MTLPADPPPHPELLLRSLPGAVSFLREDLAAIPTITVLTTGADYLLARLDGPVTPLLPLRTYSSLGLRLAGGREQLPAVLPVRLRRHASVLARLTGTPRPRYRVGGSVPERAAVISAIGEELGWRNDPASWDLNIEMHDQQVEAQIGALFLTRRLGELARTPASTTPIIAEVMVRLAKLERGQTLLDSFCGAGTILLTAGARWPAGLRLIGVDHDRRSLRAARHNLARLRLPALLAQADAGRLPLRDHSVDRIVANLPFGKRVGSHRHNARLYPAFLREAERVLAPAGRMVLLSEDKALLRAAVRRTHRIKIHRELLLRSGGATPTGFVVVRSRRLRHPSRPAATAR